MKSIKQLRLFVVGFLLVNVLWLLAHLLLNFKAVPNPIDVYLNFGEVVNDGIFAHIGMSLYRIGAGVLLSLMVGVPVGILMAYSKLANQILNPLVYFTYPIPKTALLPVAMLLLGMRDGSKIAIIFLIVVFQVIVAVRDGVLDIDPSVYLVTKSTNASHLQTLTHITLPAILPALLTSLRISLGTAVSVLFFVETYGTREGMGYYIVDAWSRIDYIAMYGGIVVISVVGFLLFAVVDILSDVICPWKSKI